MQDFKQIVGSASARLLNHPVGQLPHIKAFWEKGVEWKTSTDTGQADAQASQKENSIFLYPVLQQQEPSEADCALLREFGILILRKSGAEGSVRWEKKLCLPLDSQITAIQTKLGTERARFKSYTELVKSFLTAVDRLVALNVTNALLINGITYPKSEGVDIRQWGGTTEYCTGRKFYSILPLVSAYSTRDILDCYGCAFAEMIVNKMQTVRESSTARALEAIVRSIAELAK